MLEYFTKQPDKKELPNSFINPFEIPPHALAVEASRLLQQRLTSMDGQYIFQKTGKMFGVLVVRDQQGFYGFLSAFSGMLNKQWTVPGFVPPVFSEQEINAFLPQGERSLKRLQSLINDLEQNEYFQYLQAQLNDTKHKYDTVLKALKDQHKVNKNNRKLIRQEIPEKTATKQQEKLLHTLSLNSQQDKKAYKSLRSQHKKIIERLENQIHYDFEQPIKYLKKRRITLSQTLQNKVFNCYRLINQSKQKALLTSLFPDMLPPSGAADCAAPKLLQYAHLQQLTPLAVAEFWWGNAPVKEIRHHAAFYQPCRSRCHKILPFMLQGYPQTTVQYEQQSDLVPQIIYQDSFLIVLNKPEGLLSVPGKSKANSVQSWLKQQFPSIKGGMLLHRLDQATSGILLVAKSADVYKKLQKQFINRTIKKRYVALLSKPIAEGVSQINLPLRTDLDDRPRQLVCHEHGKKSLTTVKALSIEESGYQRVYFYPITGRTHQLRVHAAHADGLSSPIVGDQLYGQITASRLMLHAQKIEFKHPITDVLCRFTSEVPF